MLILTRKISENIIVGDEIKITVLDVNGRQVKLGFKAPKNVSVHREEIYQRMQLKHGIPELIKAVDKGFYSLSDAIEIARLPEADQRKQLLPLIFNSFSTV